MENILDNEPAAGSIKVLQKFKSRHKKEKKHSTKSCFINKTMIYYKANKILVVLARISVYWSLRIQCAQLIFVISHKTYKQVTLELFTSTNSCIGLFK